ncbi:MAG: GNAT family N-acetyltransferase [Chlamydiales bacterium]
MQPIESKIRIRVTKPEEDAPHLKRWLSEPGVLRWFPMYDEREIDDAVRIWVGYSKFEACFTAEWEGEPCGIANFYLQPYKKLAHQCLFAIIVSEKHRNKGVGAALIDYLLQSAPKFKIEILHLEVYDGNPAIRLYRRKGFVEYGVEPRFIKENGQYTSKIMMQKTLAE